MENTENYTKTYTCQLCGSENYSLLYDKGRHNKIVYNYICNCCGFVFILPRPSSLTLETLYKEGDFSKTERNLSIPDDQKFSQCEQIARSRLQTLECETGNYLWSQNNQKSVLEVGCGTGSFLRLMRACGWDVIGLEPDILYTEAVEKRYNFPIKNQFVEEFNTTKNFNLICSFHVIEHVEDPNSFLSAIHQLLLDDGYLYIECPSIDRWYGQTIDFFFWDVHINTFSKKTLAAFLAKNGFQSISFGWTWSVNGFWILAKKDKVKNLKVSWDNPERIRRIVEQANSKNSKKQAPNRILSFINKSINFAKNNPSQIPVKLQDKIQRRLKFFGRVDRKLLNTNVNNESLNAENIAIKPIAFQTSQLRIVHVGVHGNVANGGDTLLFPAVRWLFQTNLAPISFTLLQLRDKVTQKTIDKINRHDALIIGGGGLLLSDTNPNNLSGWQWACPVELLEKIQVPIIVFAIGYNRFRGQPEFADCFNQNIRRLVEKSAFFGLRNHGSIEALKSYLPEELHKKLVFQPCMTTVLNRFYPGISLEGKEKPTIAVNIAFDRHHLRFGDKEDQMLWQIAETLLTCQKKGWTIKLFNHSPEDSDAHLWFRAKGLFAEEVNLYDVPPQSVIEAYSNASLALGMRGHAQMIPFGLGCPILSLISHDKLSFFLNDIGHPEWGVDIKSKSLGSSLLEKIIFLEENRISIQMQHLQAQDKLWKITRENLESIKLVWFK